jgi:hypothetical protein
MSTKMYWAVASLIKIGTAKIMLCLVGKLISEQYCLHMFPDFCEVQYTKYESNAVEYVWFSWKSTQGKSDININ